METAFPSESELENTLKPKTCALGSQDMPAWAVIVRTGRAGGTGFPIPCRPGRRVRSSLQALSLSFEQLGGRH